MTWNYLVVLFSICIALLNFSLCGFAQSKSDQRTIVEISEVLGFNQAKLKSGEAIRLLGVEFFPENEDVEKGNGYLEAAKVWWQEHLAVGEKIEIESDDLFAKFQDGLQNNKELLIPVYFYSLRTIRYLLPTGVNVDVSCLNEMMIYEGFAVTDLEDAFMKKQDFIHVEKLAIQNKSGFHAFRSTSEEKAMVTAESFLAASPFKELYEANAFRVITQKEYYDILFLVKILQKPPTGQVRVAKRTFEAEFVPLK